LLSIADLRRVRSRAARAAIRARAAWLALVAQLGLGLPLELRLGQLDRDDRGQALADVLAGEVVFLLLEQLLVARVLVDDRGQRGPEALFVGAALGGVDHVRERVHGLGVGVGPLHRDLDRHAGRVVGELDDRGVDRLLGRVQVADEVADAVGVLVDDRARLGGRLGDQDLVVIDGGLGRPLVGERDPQPPVEERRLLEAARQRLEGPLGGLEDPAVRPERRRGARFLGPLAAVQRCHRGAARVALRPDVAVLAHLDVEPDRERVHHRQADAVQAAGDRVRLAVELAAGVQRGQHDLERRALLDRVLVHRDAAAVVANPDPAVGEQRHLDIGRVAGQRLVHRVVHNLVDQVVQTALAGRSDVHAGTLTDGLKPLEYLDRPRIVIVRQTKLHPAAGSDWFLVTSAPGRQTIGQGQVRP
jgi:hypothetical protein